MNCDVKKIGNDFKVKSLLKSSVLVLEDVVAGDTELGDVFLFHPDEHKLIGVAGRFVNNLGHCTGIEFKEVA